MTNDLSHTASTVSSLTSKLNLTSALELMCKDMLCWSIDHCKNEACTTFGRQNTVHDLKCGHYVCLYVCIRLCASVKSVDVFTSQPLHSLWYCSLHYTGAPPTPPLDQTGTTSQNTMSWDAECE